MDTRTNTRCVSIQDNSILFLSLDKLFARVILSQKILNLIKFIESNAKFYEIKLVLYIYHKICFYNMFIWFHKYLSNGCIVGIVPTQLFFHLLWPRKPASAWNLPAFVITYYTKVNNGLMVLFLFLFLLLSVLNISVCHSLICFS